MLQTWRWFGPPDLVKLQDVRQAGAEGVVTSLHHLSPGDVWPVREIEKRKAEIESAGLRWSVVESVDVSEDIKTRTGRFSTHLDNYRETIRNLAACGIRTICYNFMPALDWTRTDLNFVLPDGAIALRFEMDALAVFDLFLLKRKAAEGEWSDERQKRARALFETMGQSARDTLVQTMLAGLPGTNTTYSLEEMRNRLSRYETISSDDLRANLGEFLRTVCPVAEEVGVKLGIHPDDPPRPLLGLPRVVSTARDFEFLLAQSPESSNGITFCTGSLSSRGDNKLREMARHFAKRICFVHLRSVQRETDGESFYEAAHLEGDADPVGVVCELVAEERRRRESGDESPIPFRSDHGHKLLSDVGQNTVPGYPAVGRLRGLAELRGVIRAVETLV